MMAKADILLAAIILLSLTACMPVAESPKARQASGSSPAVSPATSPAYLDVAPLATTPTVTPYIVETYTTDPVLAPPLPSQPPSAEPAIIITQSASDAPDLCDPRNWIGDRPPYGLDCDARIARPPIEERLPFEVLRDGAYVIITPRPEQPPVLVAPPAPDETLLGQGSPAIEDGISSLLISDQ